MPSVDCSENMILGCGVYFHHYVDNAIVAQDLSYVTKISTDETSAKRGHNYITIFMDPEQKKRHLRNQRPGFQHMGGMQEAVRGPWRQGRQHY